ncbi:MAG: hypothetical protein WAQ25_01260 [Candidatus Saccharimonas sp.]
MRVVVVTKPNTDYARAVDMFLEDFTRRTGRSLEVLNPDTPDGSSFCRTYDIVEYPTIIALSNEGQLQNMWRGTVLPTISEVSYYATQD